MSWFDSFLNKVEFIRPYYVAPLFVTISMVLSSVFAPITGDSLTHKFTKPEDKTYTGETMEIDGDYVIVISEKASAAEKNAAMKLQQYLSEISGHKLSIISDTAEENPKEIIIGKTNREGKSYTIDRANLGDDGVVIKTAGEKIVLSGAEKRGAVYAVYTFLEEYFDCHWFTYDLKVIPTRDRLEIPKNIDYEYIPPITFRETDWISPARSNEYKAANKLNDNVYGHISEEYGSGISYAGSFAHTLQSLVPSSYFDEEPTIFALGVKSGERTTDQPCLTNPKTLEIAIENVRKWLDQNPNAQIISVTQNDNQNYCVCENCRKVDEEEGSHAGTMLRFVNAIADNIKNDYPNVMVDTFAYQYTRTAPKITVPRDNVIVRLCSIECKFSTPLDSGVCKENDKFVKDIKEWSKICKNLFVWDYTTNYSNYLAPFANFDVLQENLQFFAENNVIGVYEEGNYQAASSDGEFAELRCYLLAKLMWDPYCDIDKCMYDFCEAYYGDGAQGIVDFINFIDENSGFAIDLQNWWILPIPNNIKIHDGLRINASATSQSTLRMSRCKIDEVDAMWQKAKDGANTPEQLENVQRSELCWRYWKACSKVGEFSIFDQDKRIAENEKLFNDFQKFGITRLCESKNGFKENPDFTLSPDKWK